MPPPTNGPAATFVHHINQYLSMLPLATVTTLVVSLAFGMIDFVLVIFDSLPLVTWLDLSYPSIRNSFQVYRLITYPIVTPSLSLLLTNLLFLVPVLLQFETSHGTIPTLWTLLTACTVVPAIAYIAGAWTLYSMVTDAWRYAGLSAWAIGLSVWTAVEEHRGGDAPDRMIFGVVRIPSRYLPILIFLFYTLLVPGSSLILHIAVVATTYLLATRKSQLTPSQETFQRLEGLQLLGPVVEARGFVSVNQDHAFLPIFRRPVADDSATHRTDNASTSRDFPGQGQRLGS